MPSSDLAPDNPTDTDPHATDWLGLDWTPWRPLDPAAERLGDTPTTAGLYCVRHPAFSQLCYIGETGRSLRGRIRALARNTHTEEMPLRDPHTAAPCLWAVRDRYDTDDDVTNYASRLDVSWVAPDDVSDDQWRKGVEAALIAVHRASTGTSPVANFGRMLDGYTQSGYSSHDDPERGGPLPEGAEPDPHTESGVPPRDWSQWDDHPLYEQWLGIDWARFGALADPNDPPHGPGVYALWSRVDEKQWLTYVGQSSNVRRRLRDHLRDRGGSPRVAHAPLPTPRFDAQHRREEVETELIGAHVLQHGWPPRDQF